MGLGPGKMDLMLLAWEKTAEAALSVEEASKATGELQLLHNILCLVAETMDIFISALWVWSMALFVMDAQRAGGIHALVSVLDYCDALCLKCLCRATCRLLGLQCAAACFQVTSC